MRVMKIRNVWLDDYGFVAACYKLYLNVVLVIEQVKII